MTGFTLDSRLEAESVALGDFMLSSVRLVRDANYPWLVLVPGHPGLVEIIDLDEPNRARLMEEIAIASRALKEVTGAQKLNIAALGNKVRQLHVHVIARFENDPAWPNPVWGRAPMRPYEPQALEALAWRLRQALGLSNSGP